MLLSPTILAAVLALAAPADEKSIEGTWAPTSAELGGQPFPDAVLKTITMTLKDGAYDVNVAGSPDKGTYRADDAKTPKTIDVTGTEGPNKGKTFPAIYEWAGDDLRICYDLSGKSRPATFATKAGTKLYLVTYKRKKS